MINPRCDIEIYMDYVLVFGTLVQRPTHLSVSQWFEFWEICQDWMRLDLVSGQLNEETAP